MPRSLTTHIDSPREVGGRLKQARERAALSQRQLAFPGCTAAYISRIEAGARVPSLQMIQQLALRLDVSGQWLATGVEPAHADPAELVEAEVALRLGELEEAERLYRAHLQPGDPARGAALAGLGQIAFRAERIGQAIEFFEQALEARRGSTLADPGAVDSLGRAYAVAGAMESSIALFERALAEATEAQAPIEQLRFAVLLANALIDIGAYGKAERALAEVIAIAAGSDDPVTSARIFWSQSRLHSMRGEQHLASRYARRALEILERTENDSYVALAYHLLAYSEIEGGNYTDALELLDRGRALLGDSGKRMDARFSIEEARALVGLDRHAEAARAASKALALLETMQPADRGRAFVTLADVFLASGDGVRGRMLLEQGLDNLIEHGNRFALEAGRRLSDLLESEGDTAGALDALKRATEAAAAPAHPVSVGA
ncbi:MAG TPA: helix-turn-helix domain-containing protein [Gaiellaceae bacterium]|nr:helix-turn-helix domain-containing protein [Gaiellaceae bacterium]